MKHKQEPTKIFPEFSAVKKIELQLDDVMEIIDPELLSTIREGAEKAYHASPAALNQLRLGIVYHELALNLSFFAKTKEKGFAEKSFRLLTELFERADTPQAFMPFIASYRASALSLMSSEAKQLKLLFQAFALFDTAVATYSQVSYLPEFLRGSVAENLPWFFLAKRRLARKDFESIIKKQKQNPEFANANVMSFTLWAWAKQHPGKRHRSQALQYLADAIRLDPGYEAGRKRAEELQQKFMQ